MSGEFEGYMTLIKQHKEEILATVDLQTLVKAVFEIEERMGVMESKVNTMGVMAQVMIGTTQVLSGNVEVWLDRVRQMEALLEPVLWICPVPWCGAPQVVPRLVWRLMAGSIPSMCQVCHMMVPFKEIAQYGHRDE